MDALGGSVALAEEDSLNTDETAYFTYGQYIDLCSQLEEEEWKLPHYEEKYESEHELLKQDWYEAFRILLAHLDTESSIWETTVFLLKVDSEAGEAYTENGAMQGACHYCSTAFVENVFQEIKVYVQGDTLLTIVEVLPEENELGSVWVMESTDSMLDCFYHQTVFQRKMLSLYRNGNRSQILPFGTAGS